MPSLGFTPSAKYLHPLEEEKIRKAHSKSEWKKKVKQELKKKKDPKRRFFEVSAEPPRESREDKELRFREYLERKEEQERQREEAKERGVPEELPERVKEARLRKRRRRQA